MTDAAYDLEKYSNLVDIPLDGNQKDSLGVDKYTKALAKFIENAKTPTTLSIQGEWGSGKTSLMKHLECELCKNENEPEAPKPYRGIWLNIWKLSLMHSPEETLQQVIQAITDHIMNILKNEYKINVNDDEELKNLWHKTSDKKLGEKTFSTVMKLLGAGVVNVGAKYVGIGNLINFQQQIESKDGPVPMPTIPELQNTMDGLIEYCWKKDKEKNKKARGFLFFVDDLDRLDPSVAVSVLELLKNVFEVEHCVFILAIDYEVVVRGLVPKFGEFSEKNERQFRSFFDKIIQLPFNMPVESYDTQKYITQALKDIGYFSEEEFAKLTDITEYDLFQSEDSDDEDLSSDTISDEDKFNVAEAAVELITLSTGSNPRSMIRLVNSLSLNQIMWEGQNNTDKISLSVEDKLINLGFTCIQISYSSIYSLLNSNPCFLKWDDSFASRNRLPHLSDQEQKEAEELDENKPWQIIIRRATQNNVYMRQRRQNIEKLLTLIAKLATGKELTSISKEDNEINDFLETKFRKLLSFSSVTEAGLTAINTEKKYSYRTRKFSYETFWNNFQDTAFSNEDFKKLFNPRTPNNQSYLNYFVGTNGVKITVNIAPTKNKIDVILKFENKKEIFDSIKKDKSEIQKYFDSEIEWNEISPRSNKEKEKLKVSRDCIFNEDFPNNMTKHYDWIRDVMSKMKTEICDKHIKK